jgi:hypothetical protein
LSLPYATMALVSILAEKRPDRASGSLE